MEETGVQLQDARMLHPRQVGDVQSWRHVSLTATWLPHKIPAERCRTPRAPFLHLAAASSPAGGFQFSGRLGPDAYTFPLAGMLATLANHSSGEACVL